MTSKDSKGIYALFAIIAAVSWGKIVAFMLVVAIIAMVAAISLPAYRDYTARSINTSGALSHDQIDRILSAIGQADGIDAFWSANIQDSTPSACHTDCDEPVAPNLHPGKYFAEVGLVNEALSGSARTSGAIAEALLRASAANPLVLNLVPIFTDGKVLPVADKDRLPAYPYVFQGFDQSKDARIPFVVHDDAIGCGSIWISVWNERRTIALDAFAINVRTGEATADGDDCEVDVDLRASMVGGSHSTLQALASNSDWDPRDRGLPAGSGSIGLHVFELAGSGSPTSKAVVIVDDERGSEVFGWELKTTLSSILDEMKLSSILATARANLNHHLPATRATAYSVLADHLTRGIFLTEDRAGINRRAAEKAYATMRETLESEPRSPLIARFTTGGGDGGSETFFIPLRLLSQASLPLPPQATNIIYPMPNMRVPRHACIDRWTIAVPPSTGADDNAARQALQRIIDRGETRWSDKTITSLERLRQHFRATDTASSTPTRPEGLLLLGHHNPRTGIYFGKSDVAIDGDQISRAFGPGSVAVMALCSATSSASAGGVISRLTSNGFDTVVASPFQVQESYSIRLMEEFLKELDRNYAERNAALVSDMFESASRNLAESMTMPEKAAQSLEYLFAGNPDARICILSQETEHADQPQ